MIHGKKQKISISIRPDTLERVQAKLQRHKGKGLFRNKSHLIEYAVNHFLETEEDDHD